MAGFHDYAVIAETGCAPRLVLLGCRCAGESWGQEELLEPFAGSGTFAPRHPLRVGSGLALGCGPERAPMLERFYAARQESRIELAPPQKGFPRPPLFLNQSPHAVRILEAGHLERVRPGEAVSAHDLALPTRDGGSAILEFNEILVAERDGSFALYVDGPDELTLDRPSPVHAVAI